MSTCTHELMTNHHEAGLLAQVARDAPRLAASAATSVANSPAGPSATCTISACPGATLPTRPTSRSGGPEAAMAGAASDEGRWPNLFESDGSVP